jgi:hypothetical protein
MLTETMQKMLRLIPYLDPKTQQELLALVREYRHKLAAAEGGLMPESAVQSMVNAVPDKLMAEIVQDLRSGPPAPGSMVPETRGREPVKRGSGWIEPKNEDRTRQFQVLDEIVGALAGGPNDTSKLR